MWGKKHKPKNSSVKTLISRHTEICGDVNFSEGMYIEGTVKGNVISNSQESLLILNEHGTIEGEVRVPYIKLNGIVIGDVYATEHVELMSKSRITGNVYYNLIEMAIGAEVNGKLVHTKEQVEAPLALEHTGEHAINRAD